MTHKEKEKVKDLELQLTEMLASLEILAEDLVSDDDANMITNAIVNINESRLLLKRLANKPADQELSWKGNSKHTQK